MMKLHHLGISRIAEWQLIDCQTALQETQFVRLVNYVHQEFSEIVHIDNMWKAKPGWLHSSAPLPSTPIFFQNMELTASSELTTWHCTLWNIVSVNMIRFRKGESTINSAPNDNSWITCQAAFSTQSVKKGQDV